MQRKAMEYLLAWKKKRQRSPLLLYGARQVGKTYLALTFGREQYGHTLYVNFEGTPEVARIFEWDLNPARIIRELGAFFGQSISPKDTLIIFDEIQNSERALTSLKYFQEEAPEYHIIAAGSLLGVALNRTKYSFPVGKVEMYTLYPLDFEEFLWAIGEDQLPNLIRAAFESNRPFSLHEKAMDLYRLYLAIGGMPQAIVEYIRTRDFNFVLNIQKSLENAYIADMAKYASPQETTRIMGVWNSLPAQLAKENQKFQYKLIKSGARAHQYADALAWLHASGLIQPCYHVSEGKMPLSVYKSSDAFKIYLVDTGLLCAKFGIPSNIILHMPHSFDGFKGALAENYIMQALVVNGITPYYWTSNNTAELDFIFQDHEGNIIPLEAKAATHVKARSLKLFMGRYDVPYAIRVSARNFGLEENIKSIPLYAVFCIKP